MSKGPVSSFIEHHYRRFNAASLVAAAQGYARHLENGGKMFLTLALNRLTVGIAYRLGGRGTA